MCGNWCLKFRYIQVGFCVVPKSLFNSVEVDAEVRLWDDAPVLQGGGVGRLVPRVHDGELAPVLAGGFQVVLLNHSHQDVVDGAELSLQLIHNLIGRKKVGFFFNMLCFSLVRRSCEPVEEF